MKEIKYVSILLIYAYIKEKVREQCLKLLFNGNLLLYTITMINLILYAWYNSKYYKKSHPYYEKEFIKIYY